MKKTLDIKKLILLNMPYILLGLFATNFGEAWRMAQGADASEKFLSLVAVLPGALQSFWPSLHPLDLLVGLCCGVGLRLAVYLKSKNAKKYRHGLEYGSARWGTREDIAPYVDPVFQNNVILTKTESLTMNSRPKDPKTARNKNVLVIGGSGSGKTRFWLKPNLMQMHSSYVVTDPKGTILVECGKMLQRGAPKLGKDGKPVKDKNGKGIKSKSNHIDEIFFAFLNRFFWNELFIARKSDNPSQFLLDMGKGDENSVQENENASYRYLNDSANSNPNDYDTKIAYQGLDEYKYDNGVIPIEFFLKLQRVLNNYYRFSQNCTLPTCPWDSSFKFIPQYVKNENSDNIEISNNANEKILRVSTLNQVQRIVFFAICKYFDHDDTVEDSMDSMKRWIRVIWNLISGEGEDGRSQIRSSVAMRTAIEHIERLDAHDVYNSLNCMPFDERTSDFSNRWNEEINKAKQIVCQEVRSDGKTWEEVITEAEQYAFFRGSIRFLFQDENGQVDWRRFDEKWKHAKNFFLPKPTQTTAMQERYRNADLLKSMMGWFTSEAFQELLWWKHRTFNNKPETWLYYLLNNDNCKAIHHLMLGETNTPDTFEKSSDFNERTVYILATTSLLDFVITHIPSSWIRNYHNHIAIFPSGKGVFLNAEKRDGLLSSTEQIGIRKEHIIPGTTLLYGSDINFTFNNHNFQWYRNDFVYMMDKDEYWNRYTHSESGNYTGYNGHYRGST